MKQGFGNLPKPCFLLFMPVILAISFLFLSVQYQRMSDLSSVWIVKP